MNVLRLPKHILDQIADQRQSIRLSIRLSEVKKAQYTPERLKEIEEINQLRNSPIVDHRTCFDYNFDLHKGTLILDKKNFEIYQVSISKGQLDPMEKVNLPQTFQVTIKQANQLKKFAANLLDHWVDKYGFVIFGSDNENKFDSYLHILAIMASQKGLGISQLGPNFSLFFDPRSPSAIELKQAFEKMADEKQSDDGFPNDED